MHVYVLSDWIGFCVLRRLEIFFPGPEPEAKGRRPHLSSEITTSKSTIVHLVCVIIMYHHHVIIRNIQRCSFISLFVRHLSQMPRQFVIAGDIKRSEVEMGTAQPVVPGMTCFGQ